MANCIHKTSGHALWIGSDGSLNQGFGTFGYIISTAHRITWMGAGPADGNPDTASSKPRELFADAGTLELLLRFYKHNPSAQAKATVLTWIDNSSVCSRLQKMLEMLEVLEGRESHQAKVSEQSWQNCSLAHEQLGARGVETLDFKFLLTCSVLLAHGSLLQQHTCSSKDINCCPASCLKMCKSKTVKPG